MSLSVLSGSISKVGIKSEAVHGVLEAGPFRGLLVTSFDPSPSGDFAPIKKVSGIKGAHDLGQSGEHYDLTFSVCASTSGDNAAGLGDILAMLYDIDTVSGAGPFAHLFKPTTNTDKKSWSFYHEDGNGKRKTFTGFVASEGTIEIDKTAGVITAEVSGMSFLPDNNASVETVDFETLVSYTPVKAEILIGAVKQENWEKITITFSTGAAPVQTINASAGPSRITGVTQDLNVSLEGVWDDTFSTLYRDAYFNHTNVALDLIIKIGPVAADDQLVLTIPLWGIEEEKNKLVEPDSNLPQTVNLHALNLGLEANQHSMVLMSDVATAFELI